MRAFRCLVALCSCGWACASESVSLEWHNVSFIVDSRKILDSVSGQAPAGRMLAIMGPSGSGKTSLLNALAGQVKATKGAQLTGRLMLNGRTLGGGAASDETRQAYVRQEDIFYSQMTVRETLMFSARLRLPRDVPIAEKAARVDSLIQKLGLIKVADTLVGDVRRRGISGGERKRLSIGCELLGDPTLLFLDEPTSGLDSFQSEKVVRALQRLVADGRTVVASIHQPRGSVFQMFDDLLLLSDGKTIYHGPTAAVTKHFGRLGFTPPAGVSTSDWAVDIVSPDYDTEASRIESLARIAKLSASPALPRASLPTPVVADGEPASSPSPPRRRRSGSSPFTQFSLLFRRAWREVARSKGALAIKVVQQVMVGVLYGSIYSLGLTQSSIQDRFGLLSLISIGAGNLAIASTIRAFPKEKTIVMAERAKKIYGVLPYFSSKVVAEAPVSAFVSALGGVSLYPLCGFQRKGSKFAKFVGTLVLEGLASGAIGLFLGAVAPSTDVALALFPPILVLMIIFNGFNIAESNTPKALRWIPKVSFLRWCSEGLAVNEFTGLRFSCANARGPCTETGEQALERVSFHTSTVRRAALAQTGIIASAYAGTYAVLQRKRPHFLTMVPPSPGC